VPAAVDVEEQGTPDVEGVPAAQLKAIYEEHLDTDPMAFANRIGIDYRYLHRKVIEPKTPVVPLDLADKICLGLGLDVAELIHREELVIVPLRRSTKAAKRIVDSEVETAIDLDLPAPTREQQTERIRALLADYDEHCVLSERAIARREADRLRKQVKVAEDSPAAPGSPPLP
jgi:hypothetical protein